MQQGSVVRERRKLGPDVWCFRWWESGPSGDRVHRRIVLGTAEQLRDPSSEHQMTAGLVREINAPDIRMTGKSMTVAKLADHCHQRISHSTKKAYQGYVKKWIVPGWGGHPLWNIEAVEAELWLKHLGRATPLLITYSSVA
jgi:integrase